MLHYLNGYWQNPFWNFIQSCYQYKLSTNHLPSLVREYKFTKSHLCQGFVWHWGRHLRKQIFWAIPTDLSPAHQNIPIKPYDGASGQSLEVMGCNISFTSSTISLNTWLSGLISFTVSSCPSAHKKEVWPGAPCCLGKPNCQSGLETKLAPLSITFTKANQMTDGGCLKVLLTSPQAPPLPPQFTHSANLQPTPLYDNFWLTYFYIHDFTPPLPADLEQIDKYFPTKTSPKAPEPDYSIH